MRSVIDLTHRFEPPSLERWRDQVRRDLNGRDPGSLRWRSPDGVEIEPLQTKADVERGAPGAPPFVRGSERERQWTIVHEPVGPGAAPQTARRALREGAEGIWIGPQGAACLEGSHLAELSALGAPVWIEAGAHAAAMSSTWLASERGPLTVLSDPLGTLARGSLPSSIDQAFLDLAQVVARARAERPGARPILASARIYAEGGASAVDELALLVASGISCLRGLAGAGQPLADLPRRMLFELALDADFFAGIAKLRAARLLWSKVLRTLGIDGPEQGMRLRACTARRAFSLLDPQTNLLRGTAVAFAAVTGGAELVTVAPYDALTGAPSAHAERLARNTQLVLREEAQLGRVLDPAGGSYFLETLTEQLARRAWSVLQEIEHLGGVERGLADGSVAERVAGGAGERRRAMATRERAMVGVSRYPAPEAPLEREPEREPESAALIPPYRDAEPFEALRRRAAALPQVARDALVLGVGEARALGPRMDFARDALAVGGLSVRALGAHTSAKDALAALGEQIAPVVVPCASDEAYPAMLTELSPALRERGARVIVAATRDAEPLGDHADAFVHRGADLPSVLGAILDVLEGASR